MIDEVGFFLESQPDNLQGSATRVRTGGRGRPSIQIDPEFLEQAMQSHSNTELARALGCSTATVRRRQLELGLVEPQAPVRQTHVLDNGEEVVTYNVPYRNSTLSGEDLLNRIAECLQRFGPRNTDWIEGYLAGLGYVVHRSNIQRATRALELEDGDHSD